MDNLPEVRQKDFVRGNFEETDSTRKPAAQKVRKKDSAGEFVKTIFYAVFFALLIRTFLFEPFNIPSGSMIPNLLIGDSLFVSKYSYGYSGKSIGYGFFDFPGRVWKTKPEQGDVIVFKLPRDPSVAYIKRLIGLPGDRVQVKEGRLYINGKVLPRAEKEKDISDIELGRQYDEVLPNGTHHIIREDGDDESLDNTAEFLVPPGNYFFMGDNRDNSLDSRVMNGGVGFVPEENLVGRAEVVFFSIDPKGSIFEPWSWPRHIRWSRLFDRIH